MAEGKVVVVSMDAHQPNDPHFELWAPHNIVGTVGQQLYGDLYDWFENDNENLIYSPKTNYNVFFKTDLAETFRRAGVEKVHTVGVTTDICDFLAVAGADPEGFKTAIHKRGVSTFTDLEETMLDHMKRCFHTQIIE
ncbi:cysteine hydrolase family protein [Sporosarcina cascadiensis]|uniref:cysteine hydrolase family protein n=1 Tax=Sporosarcina cascadiensis TaxID=2660747 RepID=UPI00210848CF|nr:isochorismatase family protein [Sporosarcina cascadiensis]